jgi:hypothetical protein
MKKIESNEFGLSFTSWFHLLQRSMKKVNLIANNQ